VGGIAFRKKINNFFGTVGTTGNNMKSMQIFQILQLFHFFVEIYDKMQETPPNKRNRCFGKNGFKLIILREHLRNFGSLLSGEMLSLEPGGNHYVASSSTTEAKDVFQKKQTLAVASTHQVQIPFADYHVPLLYPLWGFFSRWRSPRFPPVL